MTPVPGPLINGKPADIQKSWKKINEERKELKKQRKQEKQIKLFEKANEAVRVEELAKTVKTKEIKENPSTISIAVPGSILENAQSAELRTYVAGQIARAACIFRVSEVIVFDDVGIATARETKRIVEDDNDGLESATKTVRNSSLQLGRILQYLECPQYLRKFFFPLHKDLQYSGLLNPLDTPHHLRQQNNFIYREGIICDKKAKEGFSYVNVGLLNDVLVNKAIEPGVRVTVKLNNIKDTTKKLRGTIVSPDEPRRETGVYWGYQVRIAHTLSDIFTKSPYAGGYDLSIGTSDRGKIVHDIENQSLNFNHVLVVFGGLKGLEAALLNDEKLNVDDPALLFDHYVNVLPRQGSRTIRTEEALLIAMAAFQEKFKPQVTEVEEDLSQFLPRSDDTSGFIVQPQFQNKHKKRKDQRQLEVSNEDVTEESPKKFIESPDLESQLRLPEKTIHGLSSNKSETNLDNPFKSKIKEKFKRNGNIEVDNYDFEIIAPTKDSKGNIKTSIADDLSRFD